MRFQEKREKELEKKRNEAFNQYKPMVPQGKEWRAKTSSEPAPVRPMEELVRPVTLVRPVDVDGQTDDQRHRPVSLLQFPWFVLTSSHRILHQKTKRSLLIIVLRPSA
jgi:hypothetical protein